MNDTLLTDAYGVRGLTITRERGEYVARLSTESGTATGAGMVMEDAVCACLGAHAYLSARAPIPAYPMHVVTVPPRPAA
jgi:hypothetical protein